MIRSLWFLALVLAAPLVAQRSPVEPAPERLWGELRPTGRAFVDSTSLRFEIGANPEAHDIAIRGDLLVVAAGTGVCAYDRSRPGRPAKIDCIVGQGQINGAGAAQGSSDEDIYFRSVALASDTDFVVSGNELGFTAWRVHATQRRIELLYQNTRRNIPQVGTVTVDGVGYGLGLDTTGPGVALYDLAVAGLKSRCLSPAAAKECGVLKAFLPVPGGALKSMAVLGDLVAVRVRARGLQVYRFDVQNFAGADLVMSEELPGLADEVALWRYEGTLYLASLTKTFMMGANHSFLRIYDVSCLDNGACVLPRESALYSVPDNLNAVSRQQFLTVSTDGGKPYLFVGNPNAGRPGTGCESNRGFLLDMSRFDRRVLVPLSELDLSPPGYWCWYYPESYVAPEAGDPVTSGGFYDYIPYRGVVADSVFYTAADRVGDAHRIVAEPEPPPPPVPPVPPVDLGEIFSDGFESGDQAGWTR